LNQVNNPVILLAISLSLDWIFSRMSFGKVVGTMNKLANAMENGEYDFDGTHDKTVCRRLSLNEIRQKLYNVKSFIDLHIT
jgi:hypothetical protein